MKYLVLCPPSKAARNVIRDFVYGCWCKGRRIGGAQMPPTNLLSVATVLKEDGRDVEMVDAAADGARWAEVEKRLDEFGAVILLVSTNSFREDCAFVEGLKARNRRLLSVFFGPHATFMPQYSLARESVDIIVMREPEHILRDLARALDGGGESWKGVRGIGYREGGEARINEPYPFIEDLDDLPIPDRSFLPEGLDYFNPVVKRVPYTTMQTSRGCPGRCTFCTVPSFYGKRIRCRSAGKVLEEFSYLAGLGYREIFLRDETFVAYRKRNKEICNGLIDAKLDLAWIANARVDMVDLETMRLMKAAGCHMLKFGVESGVQEILDAIRKGITLDQTRQAFAWAREAGLDTHAHVMIGCPGETVETARRTIRFVKEIAPTTASFGIHTPFPGTDLFAQVSAAHPEIRDGSGCDLTKIHTEGYFAQTYTRMTPRQLSRMVRHAYRRFYLRPSYLLSSLRRMGSRDEFWRTVVAGTNIFAFTMGRD